MDKRQSHNKKKEALKIWNTENGWIIPSDVAWDTTELLETTESQNASTANVNNCYR